MGSNDHKGELNSMVYLAKKKTDCFSEIEKNQAGSERCQAAAGKEVVSTIKDSCRGKSSDVTEAKE